MREELPKGPEQGDWTVDDLRGLEESEDYELIEGELLGVPRPDRAREAVTTALAEALDGYVRDTDLGELVRPPSVLVLDERTAVRPALIYVDEERAAEMVDGSEVSGAPDLIVEVLDDETRRRQLLDKRELYERAGVDWLLYVEPRAQAVEICRREGETLSTEEVVADDDTLEFDLFADFSLDLGDVWSPDR